MLSKNFLLVALFMLGLTACSNNEDCGCEDLGSVEARITGDVNVKESRVMGNKWTYDQIGVMVTGTETSNMKTLYKNVGYETESNSTTALFTPIKQNEAIYFANDTEIVTFAAYAPYIKTLPSVLPGSNGVISVDTRSKNNNDDGQTSINYLYAEGAQASKMNPIVAFTGEYAFKHVMSRIILTFKASISDGFTGNEIFTAGNKFILGGLKLAGNFDITSGVAQATGPLVNDWNFTGAIHQDNLAAKTRKYTLLLLPQEYGAGSKMTIKIKIGSTEYVNNQIITANLAAGTSYNYTIILKKDGLEVSGSTITDWIEVDNKEGGAVSK